MGLSLEYIILSQRPSKSAPFSAIQASHASFVANTRIAAYGISRKNKLLTNTEN